MHFINSEETLDLVVHRVGNKSLDEGVHLSKTLTFYSEELMPLLYNYFLKPFKTEEYFQFHHESSLELNEIHRYAKSVFEDRTQLVQQSVNIANHLYNKSSHPKVKGGELYVVFFPDAILEGESTQAIGIFKSETKDKFLKTAPNESSYDVWAEEGISLTKLDKGCLIFNVEGNEGYVVTCVDNTNKGDEAKYWTDDFLRLIQRQDEYFDTESTLNLCKNYVLEKLPEQFEVNKVDQVDLLNKSVRFFKENETFQLNDFNEKVLVQEELIQSFSDYKKHYEDIYEIELNDHFEISKNAVKKQSRFFKSIIKLDKNFHIYVHGNRNLIEQGVDEEGKKFYKLYYDTEN